ncbi:MAG: hypothetical protein RLZZ435_3762 [Cyanobacteriota bacterium]|jgi:hypothetical protein
MNYLNSFWIIPMLYSSTLFTLNRSSTPGLLSTNSFSDPPIILFQGKHEGFPLERKGGGTR